MSVSLGAPCGEWYSAFCLSLALGEGVCGLEEDTLLREDVILLVFFYFIVVIILSFTVF